jgi:hypothetical protein
MRAQYTDQLISRAERDRAFRQQLVDDPRGAIEEELGVELPEGLQVRVLQEGPSEAVLVLPIFPDPGELRDEELAAAAGGTGGSWCGHTHCSISGNCPVSSLC